MSALADFAHKFGSESRELKIGQSFFNDADSVFHTIRYDFVPASVDPNKTSAVDIGQNGKVTVTMPNVEGSGTTESVYQGQRKPHQKECVLIINNETGDMILEKLNTSMIVKKARLRQEDLTGKSLALNKNAPPNGATLPTGSSSSLSSQTKSSNSDRKAPAGGSGLLKSGQSVPNAAKLQKQSPPLSSTSSGIVSNSSSAQARSNGFQPKTPSPPSMPIFNKGSLLRTTNGPPANATSTEASTERSSIPKNKFHAGDSGKSARSHTSVSQAARLSSDSSDGRMSDEESSSGQSSDSSSEDEATPSEKFAAATNSRSNVLSMPSLSMPTSLAALSAKPAEPLPQTHSSNNGKVVSPALSSGLNVVNDPSSALALSLSEDSDSSDDNTSKRPSKMSNGTSGLGKAASSGHGKLEQVQKGPVFAAENKSFPDSIASMPKFSNGTSAATFPSTLPKYSQLSQDLQLSESGSDSDD